MAFFPHQPYLTLTRQFVVGYSSPSLPSETVDSAHSDLLLACKSDSRKRKSTEKRRACANEHLLNPSHATSTSFTTRSCKTQHQPAIGIPVIVAALCCYPMSKIIALSKSCTYVNGRCMHHSPTGEDNSDKLECEVHSEGEEYVFVGASSSQAAKRTQVRQNLSEPIKSMQVRQDMVQPSRRPMDSSLLFWENGSREQQRQPPHVNQAALGDVRFPASIPSQVDVPVWNFTKDLNIFSELW
ncbi:hypothetical protein B0H19DRAFT_1243532 [Mycena capillaripes]|nr:hypothetical protein B0H19DRAFT_1243532 [Mycena capillaripes]